MKLSKIKNITGIYPTTTKYGQRYRFYLEMENGDKGSAMKDNKSAYQVGQELDYSLQVNGEYTNIVETKKGGKGGYRDPKIDLILGAMSASATLVASGKFEGIEKTFDQIFSLMEKKLKSEPTPTTPS